MILMNKEKYMQLKEIILYLFGISFFTNFDIAKIILQVMVVFLLVDIFYFKEKLECGSEKIKKFIFFLIVGGIIWNFCADFNYKAARAYFKINRYFIIVFYLYSLVKYKKDILKNFILALVLSYLILFIQGIKFYLEHKHLSYYRFDTFEESMATSLITTVMGVVFFAQMISEKEWKYKLISLLLLGSSLFLIIITQTRAALLAFIGGTGIVILCTKNIKIIIGTMLLGLVLLFGFFQTPYSNRFKRNTFNTKIEVNNMSNGLRVEMWKNAIWRFKQEPIFGSGTKQGNELFEEYVENMPEETKTQKIFKKAFEEGFDDAHNMYLNGLTDNGIFFLIELFFAMGVVPYILLKNIEYKYHLAVFGACFTYYIFGMAWPIWRHGWDPMFLWLLISFGCLSYLFKNNN